MIKPLQGSTSATKKSTPLLSAPPHSLPLAPCLLLPPRAVACTHPWSVPPHPYLPSRKLAIPRGGGLSNWLQDVKVARTTQILSQKSYRFAPLFFRHYFSVLGLDSKLGAQRCKVLVLCLLSSAFWRFYALESSVNMSLKCKTWNLQGHIMFK